MKRLLFLFGVLTGILIMEVFRRQQLEKLAQYEANEAKVADMFAETQKEHDAYWASVPTERKIEVAMRLAELGIEDDEE